jgi:DNA-binding transcriptional LysR family regulator
MNKFLAIRAFTSVVESSGFTAAGEKLGMSVSSVTKMVARLEDDIGTRLLNRTTRQVTLTDYGRDFYERCVQILQQLEEAEMIARDAVGAPSGRLRVMLPISFGRVTLIPALGAFQERYPDIELELRFDDNMQGLLTQECDLAVGTGSLDDSRLVTRVLTQGPQVTVAAPSYLDRHPEPRIPQDLAKHNCLVSRHGNLWRYAGADGEEIKVAVSGNLRVLGGDSLREAAASGLGIAQGTWWLFRKDLERKSVVTVLDDYATEGEPVRLIFRADKHLARKMRVFIDFLVEITKTD